MLGVCACLSVLSPESRRRRRERDRASAVIIADLKQLSVVAAVAAEDVAEAAAD